MNRYGNFQTNMNFLMNQSGSYFHAMFPTIHIALFACVMCMFSILSNTAVWFQWNYKIHKIIRYLRCLLLPD